MMGVALIYTDSIFRVGPFETAKGTIHNDSKRRNVSDRTYFLQRISTRLSGEGEGGQPCRYDAFVRTGTC